MARKTIDDLPEEFISEILVRLPVKSLLLCKAVCKEWLSLISNPHFVKSQLLRASVNPPKLHIIQSPPPETDENDNNDDPYNLRGFQLPKELLDETGENSLPCECLVLPRFLGNLDIDVVNCSCNGLICFVKVFGNDVFIWNPSIRQCKTLPTPKPYPYTFRDTMGFGYDSISDGYKVFTVTGEEVGDIDTVPVVQIYSTSTDSWREFREPILKHSKVFNATNVVVDGLLYFYGNDGRLISFDLHKDIFKIVPLPSFTTEGKSEVINYQGSLAMVFQSEQGMNLWTLDYVSGKVSWTKKFSTKAYADCDIWLSQYLGGGQFYGNKLFDSRLCYSYDVLYDYDKEEGNVYHLSRPRVVSSPIKYTETLVSLDGFEPVDRVTCRLNYSPKQAI